MVEDLYTNIFQLVTCRCLLVLVMNFPVYLSKYANDDIPCDNKWVVFNPDAQECVEDESNQIWKQSAEEIT